MSLPPRCTLLLSLKRWWATASSTRRAWIGSPSGKKSRSERFYLARPPPLPVSNNSITFEGLDTVACMTCPWSFYICSGGGTADELFFRQFDLEFFQEFGVFVHFLA